MYNGYTNYMTWSVMATIDNTQSLYHYFKGVVERCKMETNDIYEQKARVRDALEKLIVSMKPNTTNIIWSPLINCILSDEINFTELTDCLLDNYT